MKVSQIAYRLQSLFEQKILAEYFALFKGRLGRIQVEVLNYLYDHGEVRIQELVNTLNIPKQHASKILWRLEEEGLVFKRVDPEDKRAVLFALNEAGLAFIDKQVESSNRMFERRIEKLTPAEKEKLISAMEQMVSILEKL